MDLKEIGWECVDWLRIGTKAGFCEHMGFQVQVFWVVEASTLISTTMKTSNLRW
jgi:hypothetical protein